MRKTLIAIAAAATVAGAAITAPTSANAGCCDGGAGFAGRLPGAPLLGGSAQPYGAYYGYGPSYYYAPAQVYYGPSPGCFWRNQRFWDGYTWRAQRVQTCN
jgi:hypothetical protein